MKVPFRLLFLFLNLIFFNNIISQETNQTELNEEELERKKFKKFVTEYRKNFSEIKTIVVTDKNFTEYITSHPYTLIYFHSFYDQNSIDFLPTYKFISDYLNSNSSYNYSENLPINTIAIELSDDENNSEIQSKYRLSVFPFFIIYSSVYNKYIHYTGYMNAQSLITFSMKATLDNIINVNNEKRLKQLLNPQLTHLSVLSMKSSFNFDDFYKASQNFKFALFGNCIKQKICHNYFNKSHYKYSDIILVKMNLCKNDFICGGEQIMDEIIKPFFILYNYTSYDELMEFISLNIISPIHNLTDYNYELMNKNEFKTLIYVRGKNEQKTNMKISLILQKILKNKKNGIKWATILDPIYSQNDYENTRLLSIELEDYEQNGLVLIHSSNKITKEKETYRMNMKDIKEIDGELVLRFVNEYNSGIIKKDIKSEIRPKTHPKKNLRMVVGKTFENEILNNNNKTIVLILVTLDMDNLKEIEDQIESLSIKFAIYNQTIIFNFLDPAVNEMPNMPNYDILKRPYYRYYYKNKTKGFIDFKGKNYLDQSEIEDWIIDNYGKEYGIDHKYGMRMHIDGMSELLKDKKVLKEIERKQKIEQIKESLGITEDIDLDLDKIEDNKKVTDL